MLGQWNQYQLPLVLLSGEERDKWVLTQGIASISTAAGYDADWAALFAALSMAILPMIVVYTVFQRQIQAGLTAGALSSAGAARAGRRPGGPPRDVSPRAGLQRLAAAQPGDALARRRTG